MLMGSRKPTLSPHPGEISCCQQSRLDNVSRGKWGVAIPIYKNTYKLLIELLRILIIEYLRLVLYA